MYSESLVALKEYEDRIESLERMVRELEEYKKSYLAMCFMMYGNDAKDKVLIGLQNMYPPQESVDEAVNRFRGEVSRISPKRGIWERIVHTFNRLVDSKEEF
jgi:hypothetical protein